MGIILLIIILFVLVIGVFCIYTVDKIGKLDVKARDAASEIDSILWDRKHQLSKILDILDQKKIHYNIVKEKDNSLGIGMPPLMQEQACRELDEKDMDLQEVLKENPSLKDDEDFAKCLSRFDQLRLDLMQAQLSYNNKAGMFNSFISNFPASFVAERHGNNRKNFFNYIFKENKIDKDIN